MPGGQQVRRPPAGGRTLTQVELLHAQLLEHALEDAAGLVDIVRVSALAPLVREVDLLAVRRLLDRLTDVLCVLIDLGSVERVEADRNRRDDLILAVLVVEDRASSYAISFRASEPGSRVVRRGALRAASVLVCFEWHDGLPHSSPTATHTHRRRRRGCCCRRSA